MTAFQGSKPYPLSPCSFDWSHNVWRHAVCLRKSFMATMHASTGLRPRFTSVMGAIWDSYT